MKKITNLSLLLLIFITTQFQTKAQQWHIVPIEVGVPAEIFLGAYNKIAVGDFVSATGRNTVHSTDISDELTNQLFELKNFTVLDRKNLQQILKEQGLSNTGIINESTATDLGEIIGSAVLVTGRIQIDKFDSEVKSKKTMVVVNGCDIKKWREAKYMLNVNIKVIDIETSKILVSKTLKGLSSKATSREYACGGYRPPVIDGNEMYKFCLGQVSNEFKSLLAPYNRSGSLTFLKNSLYNDKLQQALTNLKLEDFKAGIEILKEIPSMPKVAKKAKIQAKAYYNLGLAQVYDKQYEDAKKSFKQAFILDSKNTAYSNRVKWVNEKKAQDEEYEKQKQFLGN